MTKPIVFLSHSSFDEKPLKILKDLLFKKTGGAITLFLSSDGQSIPLGRNWVHELQQALDNSRLMFVFISPNSLWSSWIHFEVGYAYSKGIKVIPVAINGLDLGQVAPPLSLLQGFNINSYAGLNNLIAIINQEFSHVHEESFTPGDFKSVFAESDSGNTLGFSPKLAKLIEKIQISIWTFEDNVIGIIADYLERNEIAFYIEFEKIKTYGMNVSYACRIGNLYSFEINISTDLFKLLLPVVSECISEILVEVNAGITSYVDAGITTYIEFEPEVLVCEEKHNITARLYNTEIELSGGESFLYKNIRFKFDYNTFGSPRTRKNAYMQIDSDIEQLQEVDIEDLLNILFEKKVLMITDIN